VALDGGWRLAKLSAWHRTSILSNFAEPLNEGTLKARLTSSERRYSQTPTGQKNPAKRQNSQSRSPRSRSIAVRNLFLHGEPTQSNLHSVSQLGLSTGRGKQEPLLGRPSRRRPLPRRRVRLDALSPGSNNKLSEVRRNLTGKLLPPRIDPGATFRSRGVVPRGDIGGGNEHADQEKQLQSC